MTSNTDVDSFKVDHNKRAIEHDLLISSGLDEAKVVRTAIEQLVWSHKQFANSKAELDNLSIYVKQLTGLVEQNKEEMGRQLMSTAMLVYCAGEKVSGDEAIAVNDGRKKEIYERWPQLT
jgi:hypothetical protein